MMVRECRTAWRRLLSRPGYTVLSLGVLGVGLGVVLFLFSLIDTMMLQPLPFAEAGRLVAIGELRDGGGMGDTGVGIGDINSEQYLRLRDGLRGVEQVGAYEGVGISLDRGGGATLYEGARFSASMMPLLGVQALLGRGFSDADDQPGAAQVVVLGEGLWRRSFAADPKVIGHAVRVNGEWATVIGVLPAAFGFPGTSELWQPLRVDGTHHGDLYMVGRRAAGTSLAQARHELDALDTQLDAESPWWHTQQRMVMKPLALSLVPEDLRRWIWLMFGAGVLV
ncbi:MAG: ABC transporter permease, partial [Rhodanobacter sp.]